MSSTLTLVLSIFFLVFLTLAVLACRRFYESVKSARWELEIEGQLPSGVNVVHFYVDKQGKPNGVKCKMSDGNIFCYRIFTGASGMSIDAAVPLLPRYMDDE